MSIKKNKPKQERSKFTVDSIIEASVRIINGDVKGTLTTNKIAEVAGVSVGSLYQYFKNKESIIEELVTKKMLSSLENFFNKVDENKGIQTSEEFLDTLVRSQFDTWKEKTAVSRTLMKYAPKVIDFSYFLNNDKKIIEFLKIRIEKLQVNDIREENLDYSLKLASQLLRTSIYTYFYDPDSYDYDIWVEETTLALKKYLLK